MYSDCSWQILNVQLCQRHSLIDIWQRCGIVSLADLLKASCLTWLAHVLRMEEVRFLKQMLFPQLHGVGPARRVQPRISWEQCDASELESFNFVCHACMTGFCQSMLAGTCFRGP